MSRWSLYNHPDTFSMIEDVKYADFSVSGRVGRFCVHVAVEGFGGDMVRPDARFWAFIVTLDCDGEVSRFWRDGFGLPSLLAKFK